MLAALTCSVLALSVPQVVPRPRIGLGESWQLGRIAFSLLPLAGSDRRKTVETEVVPRKMWTHEQIQGVVNVNVPVRQTVIKLQGGGLWLHNPVAPTVECIQMMRRLEAKHGPVMHIVLGTVGLEHKALAGPASRAFPQATVWVQPGQWSFPLPISMPLLGFPWGKRLRTFPEAGADDAEAPEWADEIELEVLGPLRFKAVGAFGETAFFHKATRTLLVTDTIIKVERQPPAILQEDPRALLFHARDDIGDVVADTPATRQRGWRRICLFGLTFFPSCIEVRLGQLIADRLRLPPSMLSLGDGAVPFGLYPWRWAASDEPNFAAIQGAPFVAPILQAIILNRFPEETLDWVDRVSRWDFQRIIPCHLGNDIPATPRDFSSAFDFLRVDAGGSAQDATAAATQMMEGDSGALAQLQAAVRGALTALPTPMSPPRRRAPAPLEGDMALLNSASELCTRIGLTEAPKVPPARSSPSLPDSR